jgi:hypothetical protein
VNEHGASIGASLGPVSAEPCEEHEPPAIPRFLASPYGTALRAAGWAIVAVALTSGELAPEVRHESFWAIFWAAVVVNCAMNAFRAGRELRRA